jgi:hypothetical protein
VANATRPLGILYQEKLEKVYWSAQTAPGWARYGQSAEILLHRPHSNEKIAVPAICCPRSLGGEKISKRFVPDPIWPTKFHRFTQSNIHFQFAAEINQIVYAV